MSATTPSDRRDRPARLLDVERIVSREECQSIAQRLASFARGGGETTALIRSFWTGEVRWGRNRVAIASDRRNIVMLVVRWIDGSGSATGINQLDDASLEAAVRASERNARLFGRRGKEDFDIPAPAFTYPKTAIWSDATHDLSAERRGETVREVMAPAEARGMLSAGFIATRSQGAGNLLPDGRLLYSSLTQAQCSMTVRDAAGAGSGWAGLSSYDAAAIDERLLAERALEKAVASRNPVALEPGRYTVILEPQAVYDLVSLLMPALWRPMAEVGAGPFALGFDQALDLWRTKLGLKVMDERVTIDFEPTDPRLGVIPYDLVHDPAFPPHGRVTWIDRGVLMAMAEYRSHALETRNENLPSRHSGAFRMSGGETTVDEMIRTTKRGLLVTRFSNTRVMDPGSLLATGLTRDGLWLIENGKISKAVKNFRFTESPLFVLNSLEQLGVPVPIFSPTSNPYDAELIPAIVPPVKARDFSFTSTIDAI